MRITISPIAGQPQRGILRAAGLMLPCALGRSGMVRDKREGDGATPIGTFPLRRLFVRPNRAAAPATGLETVALSPDMGWCDDPADPQYNRLVPLPFAASHERMWRDDAVYDYVVEIGYNDDPPAAGLGSAIFLHLARDDYAPTEGCVAIAAAHMRLLLPALRRGSVIAIG